MLLKIKNKHLFFAVENCWNELDYRFKAQINSLVSQDSNENTIHELDVTVPEFTKIVRAVNNQPQGVARQINPEMFTSISGQVAVLAQQGDIEAIELASIMQSQTGSNDALLLAKIENGKTQILV